MGAGLALVLVAVVTDIPIRKSKKNAPVRAASTAPVPPGPFPLGSVDPTQNAATVLYLQQRTTALAVEWEQQGWYWVGQSLRATTALTQGGR